RSRAELVARSTHEQLGLIAGVQKLISVHTRLLRICGHRSDRNSEADGFAHARIGAGDAQSNCSAEGESRADERTVKLTVGEVERGADVIAFPNPVIVFCLAQSRT